jgi:hypothetical protein
MYRIAVLILALMSCGMALSGDLPANGSERMMVEGTITGVKRAGGGIIIADRLYLLSPRTQVERYDGRTGSTTELVEGLRVGGNFVIDERQRFVLTTVRILPKAAPMDGQAGAPGGKAAR